MQAEKNCHPVLKYGSLTEMDLFIKMTDAYNIAAHKARRIPLYPTNDASENKSLIIMIPTNEKDRQITFDIVSRSRRRMGESSTTIIGEK